MEISYNFCVSTEYTGEAGTVYIYLCIYIYTHTHKYTGCHRRNGLNFGRVFLMLNYTDITQNTYLQS